MVKFLTKNCRKDYSFIKCIKWQKLIVLKDNECLLLKCVKYPYQDYGESTLLHINRLGKTKINIFRENVK